jgi:hypothetical protein
LSDNRTTTLPTATLLTAIAPDENPRRRQGGIDKNGLFYQKRQKRANTAKAAKAKKKSSEFFLTSFLNIIFAGNL